MNKWEKKYLEAMVKLQLKELELQKKQEAANVKV